MVNYRYIFLGILLLFTGTIFSQKIKTIECEYIYRAPENISLEQAKITALERAKVQALAEAFGTVIIQSNTTHVENRNGKSDIDFISVGGSDVKGEWLETIGEPEYKISYEQNMLVVKVLVKGKAREITSLAIPLKVKILCNGTDDKFESDTFNSNDDLYLSFISPVSGYIAVYLIDNDKNAFCLLPYQNQQKGQMQVYANQRYVFFSTKDAPTEVKPYVDEYVMTCTRAIEYNQVYIIFSPNPFFKAADSSSIEGLPRQLDFKSFQEWLVKCRKVDADMNVINKVIKIKK